MKRSRLRRILVIGMADSVHLGRWLEQFRGTDYVFHIVSSSPHRRLDPKIEDLLQHGGQFEMSIISRFFSLHLWLMDRLLGDRLRGLLIARVARKFNPELIHVLEFQNAGYSYLRARRYSRRFRLVPLLLTPYGSDIYWFQRYKAHRAKLEKLLPLASGLSSECERDEILAKSMGFKGKLLPRIPAFGKIAFARERIDASQRQVIAVKGYQNKWGQASNALKALSQISQQLRDYRVVLFSCNWVTIYLAKRFSRLTGLRVTAHRKGSLSHEEVQKIFSISALYIGLSKSDGISASMIEAMANGAIPIQSDTSCCDEWLIEGQGGFLVRYDDIDEVARLSLRVLDDVHFRRRAAEVNETELRARLSSEAAQESALSTYREVLL